MVPDKTRIIAALAQAAEDQARVGGICTRDASHGPDDVLPIMGLNAILHLELLGRLDQLNGRWTN